MTTNTAALSVQMLPPRDKAPRPIPPTPLLLRVMQMGFAVASRAVPAAAARSALSLFLRPRRRALPDWEAELTKSARPLTFENGLKAWVWGRWGRADALLEGSPPLERPSRGTILLVHGWEGRGTQLGAFIAPLVERGYEVVGLDAPAHGRSPGRDTDLVRFADSLLEVGRELGPLQMIVAHSFGGLAVTAAVARGLETERLTLIGQPSNFHGIFRSFWRMVGLEGGATQHFVAELSRLTGVEMSDLEPLNLAQRIDLPTLVVHDLTDQEVPYADAVALSRAFPKGRLASFDGYGHKRILRAQPVVDAMMSFFTTTNPVRLVRED